MHRSVTFTCPACRAHFVGAVVHEHETKCERCDVPVYFSRDWQVTLNPEEKEHSEVSVLAALIAWFILIVIVILFVALISYWGAR